MLTDGEMAKICKEVESKENQLDIGSKFLLLSPLWSVISILIIAAIPFSSWTLLALVPAVGFTIMSFVGLGTGIINYRIISKRARRTICDLGGKDPSHLTAVNIRALRNSSLFYHRYRNPFRVYLDCFTKPGYLCFLHSHSGDEIRHLVEYFYGDTPG